MAIRRIMTGPSNRKDKVFLAGLGGNFDPDFF